MTAGFAAIIVTMIVAALLAALGTRLELAAARDAHRAARDPRQAIEPTWTAFVRGL